MAAPLVTRSTGDIIPASDHNDVMAYVESGTYRVNTTYVVNQPVTLPTSLGTVGVIAYDTSTSTLKFSNNGGTAWTSMGSGVPSGSEGNSLFWVSGAWTAQSKLSYDATNTAIGVGIASSITQGEFVVYRNTSGATKPVMAIIQDHASNDQTSLKITQDGAGYGLYVDGTTVSAVGSRFWDSSGAGVHYVHLVCGGDTNRQTLTAVRTCTSANTGSPVCFFANFSTGDDQIVLQVTQDSVNAGIQLSMSSASVGLQVISTSDNANAVCANFTDTSQGAGGNYVKCANAGATDRCTLLVYRNISTENNAKPVAVFEDANSTDDQPVVTIKEASSAAGAVALSFEGASVSPVAMKWTTNYISATAIGTYATQRIRCYDNAGNLRYIPLYS
jgi:hypothetical protein